MTTGTSGHKNSFINLECVNVRPLRQSRYRFNRTRLAHRANKQQSLPSPLQRCADDNHSAHSRQPGDWRARADRRTLGFRSDLVERAEATAALLQREIGGGSSQSNVAPVLQILALSSAG